LGRIRQGRSPSSQGLVGGGRRAVADGGLEREGAGVSGWRIGFRIVTLAAIGLVIAVVLAGPSAATVVAQTATTTSAQCSTQPASPYQPATTTCH